MTSREKVIGPLRTQSDGGDDLENVIIVDWAQRLYEGHKDDKRERIMADDLQRRIQTQA